MKNDNIIGSISRVCDQEIRMYNHLKNKLKNQLSWE